MSATFSMTVLRRALLGVLLTAAAAAVQASGGEAAAPGEVLVQLRSGAALPRVLRSYRLTLLDRFGARPIFRLKVIGNASVPATVEAMSLDADVLVAEPNYEHQAPESRKNNVWAVGKAQAYAVQWAPAAMHLREAQALSTGAGVKVAVLDTGVDARHPALAGRVLPGFDFVDFDADASERGSSADAGWGHGTHVAGLVALAAPGARILPLRVLDAQGRGNAWVLSEALLHAVDPDGNPATDDGAQVVTMSLGSLGRTRLFDAVSTLVSCTIPALPEAGADFSDAGYNADRQRCAASRGALMVAAAGNEGSRSVREYPAAESAYGKLAVGASTAGRTLAGFSNSGSWVDLAAPGEAITSTLPGGGYGTWSGTSMATPLVAGTAALLRSREPALTARQVQRRLTGSTTALCGTWLRQVDALAALRNATPAAAAICP